MSEKVQNPDQLIDDAKMQMLRESLTPSTKIFLIEAMRANVLDLAAIMDFETFKLQMDQFRSVCELLGLKADSVEVGRNIFEIRKDNNDL